MYIFPTICDKARLRDMKWSNARVEDSYFSIVTGCRKGPIQVLRSKRWSRSAASSPLDLSSGTSCAHGSNTKEKLCSHIVVTVYAKTSFHDLSDDRHGRYVTKMFLEKHMTSSLCTAPTTGYHSQALYLTE